MIVIAQYMIGQAGVLVSTQNSKLYVSRADKHINLVENCRTHSNKKENGELKLDFD